MMEVDEEIKDIKNGFKELKKEESTSNGTGKEKKEPLSLEEILEKKKQLEEINSKVFIYCLLKLILNLLL
jgi:hypothetical protein